MVSEPGRRKACKSAGSSTYYQELFVQKGKLSKEQTRDQVIRHVEKKCEEVAEQQLLQEGTII